MNDRSAAPSLAESFRYCPRCAAASDRPGQAPFRCPQCGFAFFFNPVVAAGAIITDRQGQVLLLRRARDPGKNKLGLPGGFVDRNETVESALAREVLEEVNLHVEAMEYLTSFPNAYTYQGVTAPVIDLFYVCHIESFAALTAQRGEVAGWLFCRPTLRELEEMAFDSNRRALELFLGRQQGPAGSAPH